MRLIERIAIRSARPMSLPEIRAKEVSGPELRDQHRSHVIDLARFLADRESEGRSILGGTLRASEQREYDRRCRVIAELEQKQTSTTSLNAARMRLLTKEH